MLSDRTRVLQMGFNLAIEFGRFTHGRRSRPAAHSHMFQSRNRVWAVHACLVVYLRRRHSGVSISQSSLGGSRQSVAGGWRILSAVSISQSSLGGSRRGLAGAVAHCLKVSISQSSLGGSRIHHLLNTLLEARFQSRNRVWAVHALAWERAQPTPGGFQSRNRVWAVHA